MLQCRCRPSIVPLQLASALARGALAHLRPGEDPGDGAQRGDVAGGLTTAAGRGRGVRASVAKPGRPRSNAVQQSAPLAGSKRRALLRRTGGGSVADCPAMTAWRPQPGTPTDGRGTAGHPPRGARPDVEVAQLLLGGGVLEVGDEGGVLKHHATVRCGGGKGRTERWGVVLRCVAQGAGLKTTKQLRAAGRPGVWGASFLRSLSATTGASLGQRVDGGVEWRERQRARMVRSPHPCTTPRSSHPSARARRHPWRAAAAAEA